MENFINRPLRKDYEARPALEKYFQEFLKLKDRTNSFNKDFLSPEIITHIQRLTEILHDMFQNIELKNQREHYIFEKLNLLIKIARKKIFQP